MLKVNDVVRVLSGAVYSMSFVEPYMTDTVGQEGRILEVDGRWHLVEFADNRQFYYEGRYLENINEE